MTEDQPTDDDDARMVRFIRDQPTWLIGLIPLLVVGLDVLIISHGNIQILGYIVRGMTVTTVVFGIFLPLVPAMLGLAALTYLMVRWDPEIKSEPRTTRVFSDLTAAIAAVIVFLTCAVQYVVILALLAIYFIGSAALRFAKRRSKSQNSFDSENSMSNSVKNSSWAALAIFYIISFTLLNSANWIPRENVGINHGNSYTAQVLSTDGEWTNLLTAAGRIVIVHTKDIVSRQPCSSGSHIAHVLNQSPVNLGSKLNPPCIEKVPGPFHVPSEDPVGPPAKATPAAAGQSLTP